MQYILFIFCCRFDLASFAQCNYLEFYFQGKYFDLSKGIFSV